MATTQPPPTSRTEQVFRSHGDVVEEHLVELGLAVHLQDGTHLEARSVHRHGEAAEPAVSLLGGVGAGQQQPVLGVVRAARPHLLAGDPPPVGVRDGLGRDGRQVGPGTRLGEQLAPDVVAAAQRLQQVLLLLLGAERDEDGTRELHAHEAQLTGQVPARERLGEDGLLGHRGPGTVGLGPRQRGPATVDERLLPGTTRGDVVARRCRAVVTETLRQLDLVEPLGEPALELCLARLEIEVHQLAM